jgi:fido (protein-threonine AMPylation protein)
LESGVLPIDGSLRNTKPLHKEIFENLTPPTCPYFAGNFRGERFKCLRYLEVKVDGDKRVGTKPALVAPEFANFLSNILSSGLKALEDAFKHPNEQLSVAQKTYYVVKFSCRLLTEFLRIHPYANGNGHIGRLIVWLVLARFGYWPKEWPLDEHPSYDELLSKYRDGNEQLLEDFVLKAIDGTASRRP